MSDASRPLGSTDNETAPPVRPVRATDRVDLGRPGADEPVRDRPASAPPARPPRTADIPSLLNDGQQSIPSVMRISVWSWIGSGIIAAGTLGFAALRFEQRRAGLRADVLARDPSLGPAQLNGVVLFFLLAGFVGLALPAILQVVLALVMSRGRNWARVLLTAVAVVSLPAIVIAGGTLAGPGSIVANYVQLGTVAMVVAMLIALVLMYLPPANRWLRAMRRR